MNRRLLLALLAVCAIVLVPWTTYLGQTLPADHLDAGWRVAWVGLDIGLIALLAGSLWLGRRRHPMAASLMTATAALLICDAWFDIVLDWGTRAVWMSFASAALAEIPLAVLLLLSSRRLLSGGMAQHVVTAEDIRLQQDPVVAAVTAALAAGPATVDQLEARTGFATETIAETLLRLRAVDQVQRGLGRRWSRVPISLERPDLNDLSDDDRQAVEAFYGDKVQRELELFSWAAERQTEFGDWAKGSRSNVRLTDRELSRFDRDYRDLITRYSLLHSAPTDRTRDIAVRWYAFPTRADHDRVVSSR